jgi:adenine deaminase
LTVPAQPGKLKVIGVQEGTLLTRKILAEPKVDRGQVVADLDRDLLKIVVYNRYQPDRTPTVGFVHGFGLDRGALATTVAHDSHNLIAVGTNDDAILSVVEAVRESGGGIAIGAETGPVLLLPLPIAGLMTDWPIARVADQLERLKQQARAWGSRLHNPFMALSFLALAVIPELKLTDLGLVDVTTFSLVTLFDEF